MFRKRVPGVGSGNRKSSAADGNQSDWRHDQTVSSGRTQSSSTIVMFFLPNYNNKSICLFTGNSGSSENGNKQKHNINIGGEKKEAVNH